MSNSSDRDLDRIQRVIDELRRAAEPNPHLGPASAERHRLGSGAKEEIAEGPWQRPRSRIGIMMCFASATAVAAVVVALGVGKLPTSSNITTIAHLEERPFVASGLSEPSKPDAFDRTIVASEQPAPPTAELAVGKGSPDGERAFVSAPPRDTIAIAAMSEPMPSAIAQEATPQTGQTMPPGLVTRQLDRDEVAALLKRGEEFITSGDLASARLVLQRAAEAGDVQAALTLAGTFDPNVLGKLGLQDGVADVAMARLWYERAEKIGSTEAPRRLEQLASKVNSVPLETKVATYESPPKCDISACNSAYVSFRESDCTYQPRNGPRRLCAKQK